MSRYSASNKQTIARLKGLPPGREEILSLAREIETLIESRNMAETFSPRAISRVRMSLKTRSLLPSKDESAKMSWKEIIDSSFLGEIFRDSLTSKAVRCYEFKVKDQPMPDSVPWLRLCPHGDRFYIETSNCERARIQP